MTDKENNSENLPISEPIGNNIYVPIIVVADEIKNDWQGGLCSCLSNIYPTCLCSFCCTNIYPFILFGQLNQPKYSSRSIIVYMLMILLCYISFGYDKRLSRILFFGSNVYVCFISSIIRKQIREKLNIEGNDFYDSCVSVSCLPCSLSQIGRTLLNYKNLFNSE
tara:strand:+ start:2842 stop:3336 length:495 start_codon:yes stop_codon:yes gene_type:complete